MKKILVLGATGSIGKNTLDIIENMPNDFKVAALVAHQSKTALDTLSKKFACPSALTSIDEHCIERLLDETKPDLAVNGIAGSAGLLPSKTVLEHGVSLALANKETVVMAWNLIFPLAQKNCANIIPVDSEHSALFHLINFIGNENISELIITASGGPFRKTPKEKLANVTVQDALKHPSWKMGKKITIDSATLANKGLEVIEAAKLFSIAPEKIKVIVHPESIVHSLVRTNDGMLYASVSNPDMRRPIFSALTYPHVSKNYFEYFDLFENDLHFEKPRMLDFPLLKLAYDALSKKSSYTIAYNAADEIAALAFIEGRISFTKIAEVVANVLNENWNDEARDFSDVFAIDKRARELAKDTL